MGAKYVGAIVRRQEDPRYLTGRGRFVDDISVAGCLHASVLRSPHAHARLAAIRTDAARACPGVVAVLTFRDLAGLRPLPEAGVPPPPLKSRVAFQVRSALQYPLVKDKVRYVGEPVGLVVAESRYVAADPLAAREGLALLDLTILSLRVAEGSATVSPPVAASQDRYPQRLRALPLKR